MANAKRFKVSAFLGKNPQLQGKFDLITKEGLLTSTNKRTKTGQLLISVIQKLIDKNVQLEVVGTGIKLGRYIDGKIESLAVINNVTDKGFTVYILKSNPDMLPPCTGFKTQGAPIRGANSKSARVMLMFGDNSDENLDSIVDFIYNLPTKFKNGRTTTFNSN